MSSATHHPPRQPRRAAYILPSLFTAGNLFLGFLAITKAFQGAMLAASGVLGRNPHWEAAALMIGAASVLDGLDGKIARMTNTASDFGRELDSLADVIAFGVAPAILAWVWGFQFLDSSLDPHLREQIQRVGFFFVFLFVMCGASRLARFNITTNPMPKNPGRPDRKYFVGLPIPAGAAVIAAIVYACDSAPLQYWQYTAAWTALVAFVSFLMVSTWRYRSFKDFNYVNPKSPVSVISFGTLIYLVWNYSQPVLLGMATFYAGSGIVIRLGGLIKRWFRRNPDSQPKVQHS